MMMFDVCCFLKCTIEGLKLPVISDGDALPTDLREHAAHKHSRNRRDIITALDGLIYMTLRENRD